MKEVNAKLNSTTAGMAFSANVVIYVFVNLLFAVFIQVANLPVQSDGYIYLSYLVAPIALTITCTLILTFRKQKVRDVAPLKCNYKYYIIALLLIFGLLFSVSEVNSVTLKLLKYVGYTEREQSSYLPSLEGAHIVLALIVIAVLPALCEEFLFRGVILNNARATLGDIRTIFIVGFCFSLFHGSPEQTVYQFICGCVFAFLALRSGSLLPGVLAHFLNNAAIIILYASGATDVSGNIAISSTGQVVLTVISAVAFVGGIIWLICDKKPLLKGKKGGAAAFFLTASVGILCLAIIWFYNLFAG